MAALIDLKSNFKQFALDIDLDAPKIIVPTRLSSSSESTSLMIKNNPCIPILIFLEGICRIIRSKKGKTLKYPWSYGEKSLTIIHIASAISSAQSFELLDFPNISSSSQSYGEQS
ncbi:unnamed protein product [Lactuca saligna]|uniref:Uncharacterized protein n=1 Tax=Lactuca saligna TaxID=75948 RepID=A0AA35YC03_LACSI|nr:unnamed protein product [Lactuca saligna]